MKALIRSSLPIILSLVSPPSAWTAPEDPIAAAYSCLLKIVRRETDKIEAPTPAHSVEWELFGDSPQQSSHSSNQDAVTDQEMLDSIDRAKQKEQEMETQTRFVAFLESVRFETTRQDLRTLGDSSALLDGENKRIQEAVAAYPDFSRRGPMTGLHDTILIHSERFQALTPLERESALEAILFGAFLGDEVLIDKVFHTRARFAKIGMPATTP